MLTTSLRPYQADAIGRVRVTIRSGVSHLVLQLPTGAGKTIIAATIFAGAYRKGNPALFIVPSIELIDQTIERFRTVGLNDIAVIQQRHPLTNSSAPLQIASVQSLARRGMPPAAVVVIDEVHLFHGSYAEWLRGPWASVPVIGLSATPWTRGLGKHFDELVVGVTMQRLIDEGYLSPYRVFAPGRPDLRGVRTSRGDYVTSDLASVMAESDIVGDIVTTWQRLGENRPTLCFCVNRKHAMLLANRFAEAGVAVDYVDGNTPAAERRAIQERFESGVTRVVCNVGVLTTGVDWNVGCIILARPTRSEMLHVQVIGRGLRTAPGKTDCLILDHSNNIRRLGFPTDIHHDRLDDGEERSSRSSGIAAELVRECPGCGELLPIRATMCPSCDEVFRTSEAAEVYGELVEVGGGRKMTAADKRALYAQILGYGQMIGKGDGWALGIFKGMTDEWPADRDVPSVPPSDEMILRIEARREARRRERTAVRAPA